jgi:hypothetical protein
VIPGDLVSKARCEGRFMVQESSVNTNRRRRESVSRVMVLEESKDKVGDLVWNLGTVFKQRAPEQGVRVVCGSKGSYPHESHVVELIFNAWNRLPQAEKDMIIVEYVDGYISKIKTSRPRLLQTTPGVGAHGR